MTCVLVSASTCAERMVDMQKQEVSNLKEFDPIELLKEVYPCIGAAISLELEHGNYEEIERLKVVRRKIEKLIY